MGISQKQLREVMSHLTDDNLARLNGPQRKELDNLVVSLEKAVVREKSQDSFLHF